MPDQPAHQPSQLTGAFKKPFAEQVAFWQQKLGNLVPTAQWDDLWKAQHDSAFMVAGAAKADLLADLAAAVDQAIAQGTTLAQFRKDFRAIVQKRGWHGWTGEGSRAGEAWRTRIIYTTNCQTSYSAGRLAQLREGGFALWVYRHNDSVLHPRPLHLAWNGLTLPPDHPFWQTHYPPNGWGCKCYVLGARDDKGAARLGGDPGKTPPGGWDTAVEKTGEQPGIDKGWGYMPGDTVSDTVRALESKAGTLPNPLAASLSADVKRRATLGEMAEWVVGEGRRESEGQIEFAAVVGADGSVAFRKRGGKSAVYFTDQEVARMKGGILVHNHPSSRSLSLADLRLAWNAGCEMVAVGHDGTRYTARMGKDVTAVYNRVDSAVKAEFLGRIDARVLTIESAERWHHHVLNSVLARLGLMGYEVLGQPPDWTGDVIAKIARGLHGLLSD